MKLRVYRGAQKKDAVKLSRVQGIPPVAVLPSAVDVCDVSLVSATVLPTVTYKL